MFLLVETVERETGVALFTTREAAQNAMDDEYTSILDELGRDDSDECELCDGYAWINDGPNHNNYDWSIYDLDKVTVNS